MSIRVALVSLFIALLSQPSAAWWNPAWTARKTIVLDTTASGANTSAQLTDVPVLLRLHSGNFPQFLNVLDGGADFRLVAGDDATPLKYHVEKFDPAAQIAFVWVKVPSLLPQSKDNKLYLYFGNQTAPKAEDSGATFDVDSTAVFHFADPAGLVTDATAYATPTTGQAISNPASLIGSGANLAGTEVITIADAPQLRVDPTKGGAVSLWFKIPTLPAMPAYILDRIDGTQRFSLMLRDGFLVASLGDAEIASTTRVLAEQWTHVALSIGNGQWQLMLNGVLVGTAPAISSEVGGAIALGGGVDGQGLAPMQVDELKLYGSARSSEFFTTQYKLEGEGNDALISYGADETVGQSSDEGEEAAAPSHFGVIIQNVFGRKEAIVEQLVIGICILMAAIAILVMFVKAVYLGRCRRATDRFLKAYRTELTETDALVHADKIYGDSPLFRIYQQAITEVRARMSPSVGAAAVGLEEKSLIAIRASLDATMVREQQKLNGLLVLLTIAISGGPFIGLLGTVVGVMVTFAAIAATGDVNIAAIAPGMAAALLATVAGLGVAIPALFGYNYLSAKAKEIAADMRVFTDEFVAKLNEIHGV